MTPIIAPFPIDSTKVRESGIIGGLSYQGFCQTESEPNQPPSKWEVYELILRIPYYIVFSRYTNKLQGFHLVGGHYEPMNLSQGRLLMPELGLSLGLWQGSFQDIERLWLRWFTVDGEIIAVPAEELATAREEAITAREEALTAREEALTAREEAAEAKRKAEILAERLRQLGLNPDEIN